MKIATLNINPINTRLDSGGHVWTAEEIADKCRKARIDIEPRGWERPSDHTPVAVEFEASQLYSDGQYLRRNLKF